MKKSFDINITTYQAKTCISVLTKNRLFLFSGEEINAITIETKEDVILVRFLNVELTCRNAWEWNKALELFNLVHPDPVTMAWHKKKFKAHPCYQDYSS